MAQHKVGFTGGLNKDLAKDKYNNKNYFNANNIKVITDAGLSTGSIENEKGNSLLFSFPTIGARYKVTIDNTTVTIGGFVINLSSTDTIENTYDKIISQIGVAGLITLNQVYIFFNDAGVFIQVIDTAFTVTGSVTVFSAEASTIYVAGWCRLNEWLVVFTTDSEAVEPSSGLCQIWKFKFTSGSRTTIEGASGTLLVATEHLLYNEYLNFSTATYIRDTVSNYETNEKGRVYWTDYFNQLRVVNVFDTDLMAIKPNDLGLVSEVTLSQPLIQNITNIANGLPSGAHYQYFYKLLDTDGRESIFSPGSQIIDIQKEVSNDTGLDYFDLDSTPAGTADNKSFEIEITNIDTDFDIIELYAVIWETLNSPAVYKVDDYSVTGDTMTFTHNSLDNNINIPVTEFMEIGIPFTAKTLEDRDKVLTAGNIKEAKFDLTFDARTYRWNASGDFGLYNDGETSFDTWSLTFSSNYDNIPETHDAVNPTNDDTDTSYNYDNVLTKQVYQDDSGTTIGGEGPNISYTFTTVTKVGSTGSRALKDDSPSDEGYNTCNLRTTSSVISLGSQKLDSTANTYNVVNEFNNTKSAKLNAILTGYARGEVYRFAIVFYSKSGQRSYAKWIGDIKFPDQSLDNIYRVSGSPSNTGAEDNVPDHQSQSAVNTYTYDIGISFIVDISSIQSQISGFEIVRVPRTASDRTRLGTGMVTNFVNYATGTGSGGTVNNGNNANSVLRKYTSNNGVYYTGSNGSKTQHDNLSEAIDCSLDIGGTVYGDSETGSIDSNLLLADHPSILTANNGSTGPSGANLSIYNKTLLNFTAPCADFSTECDFNINTTTDFIRDYGYYTCKEYIYNDDVINNVQSGKNLKESVTGYIYRAKGFTSETSVKNYRIAAERYLTDGEAMYNDGSDATDTATLGTISAAGGYDTDLVANTSYSWYNTGSQNSTPFGLGTAKQFIRLDTTTTGHITTGANLETVDVTAGTSWQSNLHYFKEVGYCRELTNQYGGNTFEARSKNLYISTGLYQIINNNSVTTHTVSVFGGDTYIGSYARQYMRMFLDNSATVVPYPTPIPTKMAIGFIFCAESPVNIAWRTGEHWGGESQDINNYFRGSIAASLPKGDQSIPEQFILDNRHTQSNNVRTDFLAKDYLLPNTFKFPNRIKVSKTKVDNELTDSWRSFPANQFDDVDGSLGEIHKLMSFKDQLIYFQDRGVGILPINERAMITDLTGAELVLGKGNLIGKYKYLTETSGTKHQHSVIVSDKAVYYYDSLQQKIYMLQSEALTEALGLHSMFHGDIKEILRDSDELYVDSPVGVHGVYDKKNERVLYTFLGGNTIKTAVDGYYSVGDIILSGTTYLRCLIQGNYILSNIISSTQFEVMSNYKPGITISFREKLQAFESFYDFRPGNYLNFDDKLLSIDPIARQSGYVHEESTYGSFYGKVFDSDITLIIMPSPDIISIFNNIEYLSEITLNKEDIVNETLTSLQAYSDYQNTGKITLSVGTIVKRRMRVWRHKLKRDVITTNNLNDISNPKLRNYYIFLKLTYSNSLDKRLVLSDVVISYTPTRM